MLWLPAVGVHVLWNLRRTAAAAGEELSTAPPAAVSRRSLVVGSLVAGAALAVATLSYQTPFISFGDGG